ncbi:hypothetical protein GCK32_015383, partial [Trichostrongylus colubriformis]
SAEALSPHKGTGKKASERRYKSDSLKSGPRRKEAPEKPEKKKIINFFGNERSRNERSQNSQQKTLKTQADDYSSSSRKPLKRAVSATNLAADNKALKCKVVTKTDRQPTAFEAYGSEHADMSCPQPVHSKLRQPSSQENLGSWQSIMHERPHRAPDALLYSHKNAPQKSNKNNSGSLSEKKNNQNRSSTRQLSNTSRGRRSWRLICGPKSARSEKPISKTKSQSRSLTKPTSKSRSKSRLSSRSQRSASAGSTKCRLAKSKQKKIQVQKDEGARNNKGVS